MARHRRGKGTTRKRAPSVSAPPPKKRRATRAPSTPAKRSKSSKPTSTDEPRSVKRGKGTAVSTKSRTKSTKGARDKYGRFLPAGSPLAKLPKRKRYRSDKRAPKRGKDGRFLSREAQEPARRKTGGGRSFDPSEAIERIVAMLQGDGFELEDWRVDEDEFRPVGEAAGTSAEFHTYTVIFDSGDGALPIDPELTLSISEPFKRVLGEYYRGDTLIKLLVGIVTSKGQWLPQTEHWAQLTHSQAFFTHTISRGKFKGDIQGGAFDSVYGDTERWMQQGTYNGFRGFLVQVAAPTRRRRKGRK